MLELWGQLFPTTTMFMVLLLTTIAAATMRAFSGFGAGLLLAPVMSLYLSPVDVVVIVVGLNFISTFQMLPPIWKQIDWPLVWRMTPAALLGIPLGGVMLQWFDADLMRRFVAAIVVLISAVMLSGWHFKGKHNRISDVVAGVTSGILTAIGGIGGPPFVLYMMSAQNISPQAIRTFFTTFFGMTQVATLSMLLVKGQMTLQQMAYIGTFLPVYVVATALGTYLFVRALTHKAHLVKRISLWFLLCVGLATFVL